MPGQTTIYLSIDHFTRGAWASEASDGVAILGGSEHGVLLTGYCADHGLDLRGMAEALEGLAKVCRAEADRRASAVTDSRSESVADVRTVA